MMRRRLLGIGLAKRTLALALAFCLAWGGVPAQAAPRFGAEDPSFREFSDWAKDHKEKRRTGLSSDVAKGRSLAKRRRAFMAQMIKEDPQRALDLSISRSLHHALPKEIQDETETPLSARGRFLTAVTLPSAPDQKIEKHTHVQIDDKIYEAFTYGRRAGLRTQSDIPFHGVLLDGKVAVHENPVRVMDAEDIERDRAANSHCPVSKDVSTVNNDTVGVDVGGTIYYLCSGGHILSLTEDLLNQEAAAAAPEIANSAWTEGSKKFLLMRLNFSDSLDEPVSQSGGEALMQAVNDFFMKNSFGKTSMTWTVTPLLTMPQTKAWYAANNGSYQLLADARAKAKAAGYDTANYNLDAAIYARIFGWSGMAYVGAKGAWLQTSSVGVANHEIGHNYGLWHANRWQTTDGTVTGTGSNVEYGDPFDTMGGTSGHFNGYEKSILGWIPASNSISVTSSGNHRLTAFDHPELITNAVYNLKLGLDSLKRTYWVDARQVSSANAKNGVELHWAPWAQSNRGTQLLDTTPGDGNVQNAPLAIGRTFSDFSQGIHITPTGKAGTVPEAIDVAVNIGNFSGNRPPTVSVSASSSDVPLGQTVTFTANAVDPDNNSPLAYYWTMKAAQATAEQYFGSNAPAVTKVWSSSTVPDYYTITCSVSDMRGGTAVGSITVYVGGTSTNKAPVVASVTANPNPAVDKKTVVNVVASDDGGEPTLTYAWSATGPAPVTFASNETNAAKSTQASFTRSGGYTLTVTVKDAQGLAATSAVSIVVPNALPTVSLTSPADLSTADEPASFTLTAQAADADGTIAAVEFYQGTTLLSSVAAAPYTYVWKSVMTGTYSLTARALDADGASAVSSPVRVTVTPDRQAPVVSITNPAPGSSVSGNVSVTASATDNLAVRRVEFYVDGVLESTDNNSPYSYTWRTNSVANGSHTLMAKAVDSADNVGQSATITVFKGSSTDTTPPAVSITSPASGATVNGVVTVNASATDNVGVTRVELYVDGIFKATTNKTPYSFSWDSTSVANGAHALMARAFDAGGNEGESAIIALTVSNNRAPVVDAGASQTVTLADPIYLNGTASDDGYPNPPAAVTLSWTKFSGPGVVTFANRNSAQTAVSFDLAGVYVLRLSASDGAATSTDDTTITVNAAPPPPDTTPPTVSITSPGAGTSVSGPVSVTATAADNVGVAGVQFKLDGINLGAEDTTSPYAITWNTVLFSNGSHNLTAVARDAAGNTADTTVVTVTVANDLTPPIISAVTATNLTTSGATVRWTTNETSDTQVQYGLTTTYGSVTTVNSSLVTSHTQSISGLAANTVYHYRVKSKDAAGNLATSEDFTFTTLPGNVPPAVSLDAPLNGEVYTSPAAITLSARATDSDGSIVKVEFFDGARKLGEVLQPPYTFSWPSPPAGTHSISVKATDNQGALTTSNAISITVNVGVTADPLTSDGGRPQIVMVSNVVDPVRHVSGKLDLVLEDESMVVVRVYNRQGKLVEELNNGMLGGGTHRIQWTGEKASSGMYVIVLEIERNQDRTVLKEKLVLLK